MNNYTIKLEKAKDCLEEKLVVKRLTFPEAAMEAYRKKNELGFEWQIISICKEERKERGDA